MLFALRGCGAERAEKLLNHALAGHLNSFLKMVILSDSMVLLSRHSTVTKQSGPRQFVILFFLEQRPEPRASRAVGEHIT